MCYCYHGCCYCSYGGAAAFSHNSCISVNNTVGAGVLSLTGACFTGRDTHDLCLHAQEGFLEALAELQPDCC